MKIAPAILAGLLSLLLVSCGPAVQLPSMYLIELSPPPARISSSLSRDIARMGSIRVVGGFSGTSLTYRRDDVALVVDPYNSFAADPASMFGSRIAAWLDGAGPFRSVLQPGTGQATRYVLEASIIELYGDFRPDLPPAAVLTIQFILLDEGATRITTAFERTYTRRVPLKQAAPAVLVRGWNAALTEILSALVQDLASGRRAE